MNVRRFQIRCSGNHAPAGLRIAVTADLHFRDSGNALEQLRSLRPDILCAPGDIMQETDLYSVRECFNRRGLDFLMECRKIAPVFYSQGNHERGMTAENRAILADAGITFLDNAWISYGALTIGGLGQIMQLGRMCEKYGAAIALHMAESPIGFMAALHAGAALKSKLFLIS